MRENMYLNYSKHYEEGGMVFNLAMEEIKKNNLQPIKRVNMERWNGRYFEFCYSLNALDTPGLIEDTISKSILVSKEQLKKGVIYIVKKEYYLTEHGFSMIKEIRLRK